MWIIFNPNLLNDYYLYSFKEHGYYRWATYDTVFKNNFIYSSKKSEQFSVYKQNMYLICG